MLITIINAVLFSIIFIYVFQQIREHKRLLPVVELEYVGLILSILGFVVACTVISCGNHVVQMALNGLIFFVWFVIFFHRVYE